MKVRVAGVDDMETVFQLRHDVYTGDQGLDPSIDVDENDTLATHVLASNSEDQPVGTGRVFQKDGRWFIGRMVVLDAARGSGLGREMLQKLENTAMEGGATSIELHAQVQALGFYSKLGYDAFGTEDMGAGIPHRWMRRDLRGE